MSLLDTRHGMELTSKGLEVLKNLDSRCFGFLGIQNGHCQQQQAGRDGASGGGGGGSQHPHEPSFVSRDFLKVGINKLSQELARQSQSTIHAELLCQLGHLYLLLEDYRQAMSTYEQYQNTFPVESSSNVNFLYGVGLIYFHNSSYKWAIEVFHSVLRQSPSFARTSEVHLRLGIMHKRRREYVKSVDHFRRALSLSGPSSFNKLEIQFHIGHLYCLQDNNLAAKEVFESILSTKSVPNSIKALTLKQLGWLYHTVPEVGCSTPDPHTKATELLTLAVGADPTSPQAWYFLGRCHAHQGSIQEAFLAYQYAISKSDESQADTWCSIGLLYHKMLQPKDSLQSYLCAVYLEPHNLASWTNMGCLYEAMAQPIDALLSYKNAAAVVRSSKKCPAKCSEHVFSHMASLEQYLHILGPSAHHQPHSLPSLYEGWTTLIPSNVREKRNHLSTPILHLSTPPPTLSSPSTHTQLSNFGPMQGLPPHHSIRSLGPPMKRMRSKGNKDPIIIRNINDGWGNQSVMSPPFTPSMMTPGHENSSLDPRMRNRITSMGVSETGSGMGPGGSDLETVPSFDSVGCEPCSSSGFCGSNLPSLPSHSAIPSFPIGLSSSVTPIDASSSSHATSHHHPGPHAQSSTDSTQFQLTGPIENRALQEAKLDASMGSSDHGTPPLPLQSASHPSSRRHQLNLNNSSDYSVDYVSGTSLSSPASTSPSLPSLPPVPSVLGGSQRPATILPSPNHSTSSKHPTASPIHWEACTPLSNSPVKWVSGISPVSSKLPKPLVSPMTASALQSDSGSFASTPTSFSGNLLSPHSFPVSVPSEAPFSPLIGAGGMNSAFSASLSPDSLPNPLSADIPKDLSSINPLRVSAEIHQVNEYLDQYLSSHGDIDDSGDALRDVGESPSKVAGNKSQLPAELSGLASRLRALSYPQGSPELGSSAASQMPPPGETASSPYTPSHLHGTWSSPTDSLADNALQLCPTDGPHLISSEPNSASHTPSHLQSPPKDSLADTSSLPVSIDLQITRSFLAKCSSKFKATGDENMEESVALGSQGGSSAQAHDRKRSKSSQSDKTRGGHSTKSKKKSKRKFHIGQGQLLSCEEPGELMTLFQDHEVPFAKEEISDSGVSSLGCNKPSISSSENNSPCETTSPMLILSPKSNPYSRFNYPGTSKKKPLVGGNLLDPLPVPFPSFGSEAEYMVLTPSIHPRSPPAPQPGMDLKPQVEIYQVKDHVDAHSIDLHGFCTNPDRPICMMRGLCSALGVEIGAFSSQSLVRTSPDHVIEVRKQIQQAADENTDPSGRRQVWKCESSRSSTTVLEYAQYQTRVALGQDDSNQSDCYSDSAGSDSAPAKASRVPVRKRRKIIHFGTNVDLSDTKKWSTQLSQLEKLPKFLRLSSPESDFLPHIRHTIMGMNSVQLYMKVPGARTPGHQENNNFCSININIGPGDCEWFAVHNQYWGVFHKLCEKRKICFLTGSWWPILKELEELKVPVYRFTQHLGDVVWLNPGTVHWVQANNVCNNIAWNVGPLTAHQFRMSWERYLWNKEQKVRSIVPMVHMTWNLAHTVKIVDHFLYTQMRVLLEATVLQNKLLLAHLKKSGVEIHWHGREDGEPTPCCNNCMDEVFNILFVLNCRGEYLVYCHKCASSSLKGFTVLQQYTMKELDGILDYFKLHPSPLLQ